MRAGSLDLSGAARLAESYVEAGVNGLIILGTTGEGSLLSPPRTASLYRGSARGRPRRATGDGWRRSGRYPRGMCAGYRTGCL
nr:dihydrodipicolinate synthase family protein [Cupriavidus sp. amp6]